MKLSRKQDFQICPRCGLKSLVGVESCPECGLIFSRLDVATNKDAKKKILRYDRDFIIRTTKLPSDVSFVKLLVYSILLGPTGAHCFYVGRYLRGSILLTNFIFMLMLVIFNAEIAAVSEGALLGVLSTLCGFVLLMWPWDVFMIIFKKFKVPVAIDIDGDIERAIDLALTSESENNNNAQEINTTSNETIEINEQKDDKQAENKTPDNNKEQETKGSKEENK